MSTFLKISLISLTVLVGLLSFGHLLLEYSSVRQGLQIITAHNWIFTVFRYTLYALVVVFWSKIIKKIGKKQHWEETVITLFAKQRLKIISLFVFIEAFYIYNLPAHFIAWF